MPICSYLVIPDAGASEDVRSRLSALRECDVVSAEDSALFLLVTDTESAEREAELRTRLEGLAGIRSLFLAFGEVDPDGAASEAVAPTRRRVRTRQAAT